MGRRVCKEFEAQRLPYVVIERDEHLLEDFPGRIGVYVHGDATSDEVLRRAGVERVEARRGPAITPEAADAGRALLAAGVEVVVVSNSGTDKLRRWFAHARHIAAPLRNTAARSSSRNCWTTA